MFTFGCWCYCTLTVTISWCYVITWEWWFHMHFIHAEDFSLLTRSNFMHITPWSNGTSPFSVSILTFSSVSVVYLIVFLWFYLFLCVTAPNHSRRTSYIYIYIYIYIWVFANGPGDKGSIPGQVIPKTQKTVLGAALLYTQQYKVQIKGKVEQSREKSSALPCCSYFKGSL